MKSRKEYMILAAVLVVLVLYLVFYQSGRSLYQLPDMPDLSNKEISRIGAGLLVFLGVSVSDEASDADFLSEKIVNLRIFEDGNGKMNRSVIDRSGEILVVSQFTLYGDCRKGRRPSFVHAAPPEKAEALYTYFIEQIKTKEIAVQSGKFQAMMKVSLVNDGPVTLIVESKI